MYCHYFFFNDTATTEIYTLSLHDALPISRRPLLQVERGQALPELRQPEPEQRRGGDPVAVGLGQRFGQRLLLDLDRKSTRLNSSHANISYAVFCLKKKNPPCAPLVHLLGL